MSLRWVSEVNLKLTLYPFTGSGAVAALCQDIPRALAPIWPGK